MAQTEAAPSGPVETPPPHTDAYMAMDARRRLWSQFGVFTAWSSLILLMVIGYATFTLTMGVPWLGALIGFALFGIAAGMLMNLGGAWIATVVALGVLALFIQLLIAIGSALL